MLGVDDARPHRTDADRLGVLLVDYGEVISKPQPPDALAAMAALTSLELTVFVERYWEHRPGYDRGAGAQAYWSAVIGGQHRDDGVVDELVRLDLAAWSHWNPETLDVLSAAHDRGWSLSMLSNAPHDLAAALSERPPLACFEHLLFSSRLGLVKPDPAVFHAALDRLGRPPDEVLFIDDRLANVEAARRVGMGGLHFTSAERLRAELLGLDRGFSDC